MSVPLNTWTTTPIYSAFVPPIDDPVYDPISMRATGGVDIGDGSQGREVQFWGCSYNGTDINVIPEQFGSSFALTVPDVLSCCLAFDSNMAVAICYTKADGGYLYFFNSLTSNFETMFIAGITSNRVAVDKTAVFFDAQSDVIYAYIDSGDVIRWRQQRDRYAIEYTLGPAVAGKPMVRMGPNVENRLQIQQIEVP
jgi:hypothetical protein